MPGLKDNQTIELTVNKYGSIIQKKSKSGDGFYFMLECEVDGRSQKVWGEMPFLKALVIDWPGAEGTCTVEKLNSKRYDVTITDPGDLDLGPDLKTWDDDHGGFVELEMPDFDGPAPKQPKKAEKAPAKATASPAIQALNNGKTVDDIARRYHWALGLSQKIWNRTFTQGLGDSWEPDNVYWENVRASANSLFIESSKLPDSAFQAAVATAVEALDGEVVEAAVKEDDDDLPF
tara:strand:- start:1567 stop:2265 length:699 start_codon:yes stop_codon:yes gene_type:complete